MPDTFFSELHFPSPVTPIIDVRLAAKGVQLWLKRDDLLHAEVSGNKCRKLRYNFQAIQNNGIQTVVTVGGAFSNHLHATAALGKIFNLQTIGIVRGEASEMFALDGLPKSPTLRDAVAWGMTLHFVNRSDFRQFSAEQLAEQLNLKTPYTVLPEGGTNVLALQGCRDIVTETNAQMLRLTGRIPDAFAVASGTGGTASGMIAAAEATQQIHCIAALKGADFLKTDIQNLLNQSNSDAASAWTLHTDYHGGGYAKMTTELLAFIQDFRTRHQVLLDPIYTAKLLLAIFDLVEKDYFSPQTQLVAVHTGGLQGWKGMAMRGILLYAE